MNIHQIVGSGSGGRVGVRREVGRRASLGGGLFMVEAPAGWRGMGLIGLTDCQLSD